MTDASLIFLLVAKGCPSSDRVARGKTPKGCWRAAFTWRNRRDSLVRSIIGCLWQDGSTAYSDRACAVLFSEDWSCWLLHADALVASVAALEETSLLTKVWRSAERAMATGSEVVEGVQPLLAPRRDGHLEAAAFRFLRTLGSPKDSVLVILDDAHRNPMPVLPKNEGRAPRRAVCVLGCPAGLTSQQEAALASAARSAGWQVLLVGLGHAAEFTSKILARLQVCHSTGHFLPALRQLGSTGTPWPTQQHTNPKCFGQGVSLHFLLPVPLAPWRNNTWIEIYR